MTDTAFCTIVDETFLPHALVLLRSLQTRRPDSRVWAFCLDQMSLRVLHDLTGPNVMAEDFSQVEAADPDLLSVRASRTRSEYCWTATPIVCRHLLTQHREVAMVTYLDADLMFFADPQPVLEEMDEASVLLFPQRISWRDMGWSGGDGTVDPAHRLTQIYGSFNAGSITFRKDQAGLAALEWWRERCLEWCFDREEPGRWADQRYLEELLNRFAGVRVTGHPGAALAPWNTDACRLSRDGDSLVADGVPAVFHHYQSLRLLRTGFLSKCVLWLPNVFALPVGLSGMVARHDRCYSLSRQERYLLWDPYVEELGAVLDDVLRRVPGYRERLPVLDARSAALDAGQALYMRLYRLAAKILPGRVRAALSRARLAAPGFRARLRAR